MKYKLKFLLIIATLITFEGCTTNMNQIEESSVVIDDYENPLSTDTEDYEDDDAIEYVFADDTPIKEFDERYENIKQTYPDKTILVWATDISVRYEDEVNEYLAENGYDFVICFKNLAFYVEDLTSTSYMQLLNEELESGGQADIIDVYRACVYEDLAEPIDDYLENTEYGKALYELMGDKYWESLKVDGSLYGIDGSLTSLKDDAGYELNSQLVDEYDIDIKAFSNNYIDSLNEIIDLCSENGWTFGSLYLNYMEAFTDYQFINDCVYIDENGNAANIYESKFVKELFNIIAEAYDNGVMINAMNTDMITINLDTYFGVIEYGSCWGYANNYSKSNLYFGLTNVTNEVEVYRCFPHYSATLYPFASCTGICSRSEYKDQAFEALCAVFGNEDVVNILCFGTDYEIVDGCVQTDGYYSAWYENRILRTPLYGHASADSTEKYAQALQDFEVSQYIDFYFSKDAVSEETSEITEIIINVDSEFPSSNYSSAEEYLADLNARLYDAGLQDILDEANKQLEEYYEKNN